MVFAFTTQHGPVGVAFTDRHGGVSAGPFSSLNLALGGDDDRAAVEENHLRAAQAFTSDRRAVLVGMRQVHGDRVLTVTGPTAEPPEADGLVTAVPGTTLLVRAADCVPLVLADPAAGVVGVVHAGRAGMVNGVTARALDTMQRAGAADLVAWVGPHICGRCYEVPAALRDEVGDVVPESVSETSWGTPALDIGAGVAAQLRLRGVEVVAVGLCTRETPSLYSYRRDRGTTGRHAGLVQVRP